MSKFVGGQPQEGREPPDATLTKDQGARLKETVRLMAATRDHHELMYLAREFKAASERKKGGYYA